MFRQAGMVYFKMSLTIVVNIFAGTTGGGTALPQNSEGVESLISLLENIISMIVPFQITAYINSEKIAYVGSLNYIIPK